VERQKGNESCRYAASTIHRAQGGEEKSVVVDLTTHSPRMIAGFFRGEDSAKLVNVAISRPQDQLIIIANRAMLRAVRSAPRFWGTLLNRVEGRIALEIRSARDLLEANLSSSPNLPLPANLASTGSAATYSHADGTEPV